MGKLGHFFLRLFIVWVFYVEIIEVNKPEPVYFPNSSVYNEPVRTEKQMTVEQQINLF